MRYAPYLVLALILASRICLTAQPHIEAVFPRPETDNIAVTTAITIRTAFPLDTSSLNTGHSDSDGHRSLSVGSSILLLPDGTARQLPRNQWHREAVAGTLTQEASTLLRFTPYVPLQHDMAYRCVVQNLFLKGIGITPPFEYVFTTAKAIPTIGSSTIDSGYVLGCAQRIWIRMLHGTVADLEQARKLIQVQANDSAIGCTVEVMAADNSLRVSPTGVWPEDVPLKVHLPWNLVTGSDADRRTWTAVARHAMTVRVEATSVSGDDVPDSIARQLRMYNNRVVTTGSVITLSSPEWLNDDWKFVRWEFPSSFNIAATEENTVHLPIPCSDYTPMAKVVAILRRVSGYTIPFNIATGGKVRVYDMDGTFIWEGVGVDTLFVPGWQNGLAIVSIPLPGYMAAGYNAKWGSLVNGGNAVLVLGSGGLRIALNAPDTHGDTLGVIAAKFDPIGMQPVLEYAVSGRIVDIDADPLFRVEDHVVFTTPSFYKSSQPGQRTLCIRAQPCWEIVSATLSRTGKTVMFAPGASDACIMEEMDLVENTVVFSVRRIGIKLRIDHALLKSDNPDDYYTNKDIHPDVLILVERRVRIGTENVWEPLAYRTCKDVAGLHFRQMGVRCGDELRITVANSKKRGQLWQYWGTPDSYVTPTTMGQQGSTHYYHLAVSGDYARFDATSCAGQQEAGREIRLRACFRQTFGIDAISIRALIRKGEQKHAALFEETWLDPLIYYDKVDGEIDGGRQIEYMPRHGTSIKIRFTTPVDVSSIYAGGLKVRSYNNVDPENPLTNEDFEVLSSENEHIGLGPLDGSPLTTVEFRVCDPQSTPRRHAMYYGHIDLHILKSMRNEAGESIVSAPVFALQSMERTGYALNLVKARWYHDEDPDFWFIENAAEVYHAFYGGFLGVLKSTGAEMGFTRYPVCPVRNGKVPANCVHPYSEESGEYQFPDLNLLFEPYWLNDYDRVFSRIMSFDEDCMSEDNCLVNNVYRLLDRVRLRMAEYEVPNTGEQKKLDWDTIIPELITEGATFIRDLLPIDEQDEQLGESMILAGPEWLWGARTPTSPNLRKNHRNGYYDYAVRLYPRRAIVR